MRTLCILAALALAGTAAAAGSAALGDHATASATDLLHAERLAEHAAKRLRTRESHAAGWLRGGGGFDAPAPVHREGDRNVTINLRAPRGRPAER
jgi:hypothetical protein